MEIEFYEKNTIGNEKLLYAIIVSRYRDKWVYVKHKRRKTWEIPAGHREIGEDINFTAKRELIEETGAEEFKITHINDYSLIIEGEKSFASLFYAEINSLGELPNFEIGEVKLFEEEPKELTYPSIQPLLIKRIKEVRGIK